MDWIERLNRDVTGRVPLLAGESLCFVEILHWAYSSALSDNVPHRHTFFEVCLVGGYGSGIFRVMGQEHPLSPGDLFIARPGVLHQIQNTAERRMELSWVSFVIAPLSADSRPPFPSFVESGSPVVIPENTHALLPLWHSALPVLAGNSWSASESVSALASALIAGVVRTGTGNDEEKTSGSAATQPTPGERAARIAVRYIHDNLNRPISVAEIATQVHVSPRHLTRLVHSFVGVSPAAYIERARMDRAATLLSRSAMPIKEIAEVVGYGNIHHFTRAFTRAQGKPPGVFRGEGGHPIRRSADTQPEGTLV